MLPAYTLLPMQAYAIGVAVGAGVAVGYAVQLVGTITTSSTHALPAPVICPAYTYALLVSLPVVAVSVIAFQLLFVVAGASVMACEELPPGKKSIIAPVLPFGCVTLVLMFSVSW